MDSNRLRQRVFILACLLAPIWIWARGEPGYADDQPAIGGSYRCRPIYADYITHLGQVYLNNGVPPPQAFGTKSGTVSDDGQAAFQVYALTDDTRFYADVTTEYQGQCDHGRHPLRVRIRPGHGSRSVEGKIEYLTDGSGPRLIYTPNRKSKITRTALVTFLYDIVQPHVVFTSTFTLTIPPGVGGSTRDAHEHGE